MSDEKIMEPMKTLKELHDGKQAMYEAFIKASQKFRKAVFTNKVGYGKTNFEYANLAEIIDCINKPLLDNGFFIVHDSYMIEGGQRMKTYLQYKNGLTMGNQDWPVEVKNKTMQEVGAQETYIRRYSLCNICALFADSDNDAKEIEGQRLNDPNLICIAEGQVRELRALLEELPPEEEAAMLKWCQVSELAQIPAVKLMAVKRALESKIKKEVK